MFLFYLYLANKMPLFFSFLRMACDRALSAHILQEKNSGVRIPLERVWQRLRTSINVTVREDRRQWVPERACHDAHGMNRKGAVPDPISRPIISKGRNS